MLRPIFIACGTPFCQAARAQCSVTRYGFLDDGIVYVNHSSPESDVAGRKIFQMASSSESRWGLSCREDLGGGTQAFFQLGGAYAFSNQASSTSGAGLANDRAYTFGARYQNGPLVAAASYLEVNQPTAGNTGGNNQSGAGAGDYVNLRNIFSGPVIRQQAVAGRANYTRGPFTAGLVYSWVKLSHADRTSLRLSNYEANGRHRFAAEWQAGVAFIYTDGYAGGATALASSRSETGRNGSRSTSGLITRCRNALVCTWFSCGKRQLGMRRKPLSSTRAASPVDGPQPTRRRV